MVHHRLSQRCISTRRLLLIFGGALLVLWGCGASGTTDASGRNNVSVATLTQTDNGKNIKIRLGDRVVVNLKENPTTGYQWTVAQNNSDVLKLESSDYAPLPGRGEGKGGQRTFTFTAQKVGSATPHFKLWREWQGDKSIVDRFAVTVQVKE